MTMTGAQQRGNRRRGWGLLSPVVAVLASLLLTSCGGSAGSDQRAEYASTGLPSTPCDQSVDRALDRGAAAVRASDPRVAVGIVTVGRGGAGCVSTYNGQETFPTASVVKLLIAIDVLGNSTEQNDAAKVEQMLATSDDAVASELWSRRGAGAIVTRSRDLIGLPSLSSPTDPGQWGSTRIDAATGVGFGR